MLPFNNCDDSTEKRIDEMIEKLTLEEKIDLLGGDKSPDREGDTFGNARVGILPLKFADASVGIHWWTDKSTTYPATIALAATWDADLAFRAGRALGRDARARGIHVVLGPGVNIYRSPLCGRNFEYLGEDPALASACVVPFIRGLQEEGVSATVKHYAANYQEYDRHGVSSDMDERTMREVYLPAFEAAVKEAGVGAVMTSYNLVNGVHASEHDELIRKILKGEWGFSGLVMSDWLSTYSAVNAANAGLDLEMPTGKWLNREYLLPAVRDGLVDPSVIDDKVRRLLRLIFAFDWLNRPQLKPEIPLEDPTTAAIALEVARRGCVLLKNENSLLPLDPNKISKLAVIGPFAKNTPIGGGGSAYNTPWRNISVLQGLQAVFGREKVQFASGLPVDNSETAFTTSQFFTPDGLLGVRAEYFNNQNWIGEPALIRTEERIDQCWSTGSIADGIDEQCFSVRWRGLMRPEKTGTYAFYQWFQEPFCVSIDGEAIFDVLGGKSLMQPRVMLKLEAGREYTIEVLYQQKSNYHAARFGWEYRDLGFEREATLQLAREADAVVVCCGHDKISEGESFDRDFSLFDEQKALLQELSTVTPNLIVVLTVGGNVDMRGWLDGVAALLLAWYPGQEGGTAIAELLTGKANPSGRLPATFEYKLEDRSSFNCYHDIDGDKRVLLTDGVFGGYRHHDRTGVAPRFPFGFGLSYTTFAYSNLQHKAKFCDGDTFAVSFDITNVGARSGYEVAQLYVRDCEASVPRPIKELKSFATIELQPGECRTVTLNLTVSQLQFFCPRKRTWTAESGDFEILIGASAADIRLQGSFVYSAH